MDFRLWMRRTPSRQSGRRAISSGGLSVSISLPILGSGSIAALAAFDLQWLLVLALVIAVAAFAACLFCYRRQAKVLRAAEGRYRELVDQVETGIYDLAPDGRFLRANPALARMFGCATPGELTALSPEQVRQFYTAPQRDDFLGLFRTSDAVAKFESEVRRRDGASIWI